MGSVAIKVGCPHRLVQPIGPHTAEPCPACHPFAGPPRLAWALTIDPPKRVHTRLAEAAATARRYVPSPVPENLAARAIADAARRVEERIRVAADRFAHGMQGVAAALDRAGIRPVMQVSPIVMTTTHETGQNTARMLVEQEIRLRGLHAR